jgi:hypothetical protein
VARQAGAAAVGLLESQAISKDDRRDIGDVPGGTPNGRMWAGCGERAACGLGLPQQLVDLGLRCGGDSEAELGRVGPRGARLEWATSPSEDGAPARVTAAPRTPSFSLGRTCYSPGPGRCCSPDTRPPSYAQRCTSSAAGRRDAGDLTELFVGGRAVVRPQSAALACLSTLTVSVFIAPLPSPATVAPIWSMLGWRMTAARVLAALVSATAARRADQPRRSRSRHGASSCQ